MLVIILLGSGPNNITYKCPRSLADRQRSSKASYTGSNPVEGTNY